MKTKFTVVFALIALVLGGVCAWQATLLRAAKVRLIEAEKTQANEKEARAEEERRSGALEQRQAYLNQQLFDLSALVGGLRAAEAQRASNAAPRSAAVRATPAESEAESGPFGKNMGKALSKMMSDPAMKEMMRSQQKTMIDTMYGTLFKEMNLSPEERQKFSELLLDQQTKTMEAGMGIFEEGGLTNVTQGVQAQQKESEEQLKALLGEERFAQYQEYQKTVGDRMQLDQLRRQMETAGTPVQDGQLQQLLALTKEERERVPAPFPQDPQGAAANMEKMLSGEFMEKQMAWQEEINRRVIERATSVLTPEQLKAYEQFQTQQINMQKLGLKMMKGMFGGQRREQ
jgi:hypothetical protein